MNRPWIKPGEWFWVPEATPESIERHAEWCDLLYDRYSREDESRRAWEEFVAWSDLVHESEDLGLYE